MLRDPSKKYKAFRPIHLTDRTWPDTVITRPPIWCSVDLRDGNQALIEPMDAQRKLRMFNCLIKAGFKEIEVGFPSASQLDFEFVRRLIQERLIPKEVTIQVLTQARMELIERTFESLRGVERAIVHVYNATAPVMRRVVFGLDKPGILNIAVTHAKAIRELTESAPETNWYFEYSPEMFSSTELEFSKEVCDAVVETFGATPDRKLILNLPSTVECASPNIFADQIEWLHRNLHRRDAVVLSVHPHNDRGTGTAAAEFAIMAGADRLEGCLFGNGERTGNLDLVNVALNMYTQGVDPELDFSDIDDVRRTVEYCNQLPVHARHPYVGDLVFTSFSGSHQDAIKKAFAARQEDEFWEMPYLPIDPKDLGRTYEAVIRINSQSGKGGISYVVESEHGLMLPRKLQTEFSRVVQGVADSTGKELTSDVIWDIFKTEYLASDTPFQYVRHRTEEDSARTEPVLVCVDAKLLGGVHSLSGRGNGPIDGFCKALDQVLAEPIGVLDYHEHAIGHGANATAVSYIELRIGNRTPLFGVGMDPNIVTASFKAILSALNRANSIKAVELVHKETLQAN